MCEPMWKMMSFWMCSQTNISDEQWCVSSLHDERCGNPWTEAGQVVSHLRPAASFCMAASRSSDFCCERRNMLRSSSRWSSVPTSSPRTVFIWLSSSCVRWRELRRSRLLRWTFCSRSDTKTRAKTQESDWIHIHLSKWKSWNTV